MFLIASFPVGLIGQVNPKYDPMDWVLFRQAGSIGSITQGFSYIYLGSSDGGIYRYNIFRQEWDDPLTQAQGLPDNTIESVLFDKNSGTLWVATPGHISYTYNREGHWYNIAKSDLGLNKKFTVERIGYSDNYIWIDAGTLYYQLDRSTGILLNAIPHPDETNIRWNSGLVENYVEFPPEYQDYTIMDGWIFQVDRFLDYYGRTVFATTFFLQEDGTLWVGTNKGYVLTADPRMKIFKPFKLGMANTDVTSIMGESSLYLSGRITSTSVGITYFDPNRNIIDWYEPEVIVNLPDVSFTSSLETPNHYWFGGDGQLSIYNKKDGFWKTISAVNCNSIYTMVWDSGEVWIGGNGGIDRFNARTVSRFHAEIESLLHSVTVYDIEVNGDEIWFATSEGIIVYNKTTDQLMDGNQWAKQLNDVILISWNIEMVDSSILTASNSGIHSWDKATHQVDLIVDPSQYQNQPVTAFEVLDSTLFVGTQNGLYRMGWDGTGYYHYNYSFIHHVNDMYINNDDCWLATDQGLVWFNWRKDL